MSLQKGILVGAGVLCTLGFVLRLVGIEFGLDLMIVGVFGVLVALAFAQRSTQNLLSTTGRNLAQRTREVESSLGGTDEKLDELEALQRTTLWYVKNRPGASATPPPAGSSSPRPRHHPGTAGRSATPDVSNASADLTFASALDPTRDVVIGGILANTAHDELPPGTAFHRFMPHHALESLESVGRIDLIVIDEAELGSEPWSRSVGPTGIPMLRDLLDSIRTAKEEGVQAVILPARKGSVPDIHSSVLDDVGTLRLPLSDDAKAQTSGAPVTSVLDALEKITGQRRSA